ncbi:hypothetical protein BDZ45DRAFT_744559 [Acephala macrosclerotiorum]|nr:hypothetical protein BDZ45DRAFT_744559 [Acephala macrosclerotiorum]
MASAIESECTPHRVFIVDPRPDPRLFNTNRSTPPSYYGPLSTHLGKRHSSSSSVSCPVLLCFGFDYPSSSGRPTASRISDCRCQEFLAAKNSFAVKKLGVEFSLNLLDHENSAWSKNVVINIRMFSDEATCYYADVCELDDICKDLGNGRCKVCHFESILAISASSVLESQNNERGNILYLATQGNLLDSKAGSKQTGDDCGKTLNAQNIPWVIVVGYAIDGKLVIRKYHSGEDLKQLVSET